MKKHIICLGDSNTHGYCADSRDCADYADLAYQGAVRFNEDERWTCRLQDGLPAEYLVIEEGRSGRTTVFDDPLYEHISALDYLDPCLKSHEPVDLLIIMLGTNDTKERFAVNAECIGLGLERIILKAKSIACWGNKAPNILVMAPRAIRKQFYSIPNDTMGAGCVEKSEQLAEVFARVAARNGCHFLDTATLGIAYNKVDFMHLSRNDHKLLADKLIELVPTLV